MITLSGLPWIAHSPSLFECEAAPIWLAYDGRSWRVAVRGTYGTRQFGTRAAALDLIAYEFARAQQREQRT